MISLHEPLLAGNEWKYVKNCLDQGWVSSAGKFIDIFEKILWFWNPKFYPGAFAYYVIMISRVWTPLRVSVS